MHPATIAGYRTVAIEFARNNDRISCCFTGGSDIIHSSSCISLILGSIQIVFPAVLLMITIM